MARILVIDDEPLARRAVVRMLETLGHEVREAGDGTSGLRLWREASADLVITDLAMPDLTGFEVIGILRAESPALPIIAMSGSLMVADQELVSQAAQLGAQLLGKPFSWEQLTAAVAAALPAES
jgi:two-component system OmpR family response regulator